MSTMKRIIVTIIVGIIALLGFYTTSNAYTVGEAVDVTYGGYEQDPNMYCAEHGQILSGDHNWYTVVSQVKIEGRTSTDYMGGTRESWYNAKFAYILSADNGPDKATGPVANAVWNCLGEWLNNVGQYHAGLSASFTNGVAGSPTSLETEATNYANSLPENMEIKDNTDKSKIKVKAHEQDGKAYIKVGPFNWEFPGSMTNITAKNEEDGNIKGEFLYSSYNGTRQKFHDISQIQSGKNFYIYIPMDGNMKIEKIASITGYATTTVKGVNISFLQAVDYTHQNLIVRNPYEVPVNIETPFDYDIFVQGHLKIIKVNEDDQEVKLPGVGFYIQHKETGKYVKRNQRGEISYVEEKNKATEFITNSKGEIKIKNLMVGTYTAYETKNPNYGYEMITEGIDNKVVVDKTSEYIITNKQIYVKLSGYVWVDNKDSKAPQRNDLYKSPSTEIQDGNDILFNGVTVRLKDRKTGETVKETVTSKLDRYKDSVNDGNGEYLFMDVLIKKLQDYYIEFEYDGLTYTNVIPHVDVDRGSKAAEKAEGENSRDEFNKNFSSVEGESKNTGFTRDANGNRKHDLAYTINETETEATLINNGQFKIIATTDVPNPTYFIREHFAWGQEEIPYINLGLYKRDQPDIGIMKDINNVRVAVNGYEHTYLYRNRLTNYGKYDGQGFNVGVEYGINNGNGTTYTRPIYKSDYEYINEKDKSKELKVYIIYEIAMQNKSQNSLAVQVNSLVDYYDANYELLHVGTKLNEDGSVIDSIQRTESERYNQEYKKVIIYNNTRIETDAKNDQESIYVEFALNREAVANILTATGENLDNVAEINSYSIYQDNKIYAGIDKNSNPGNYIPGEVMHEDDTNNAPGLKLEVAATRELSGKVFEDNVIPESGQDANKVMTGKVRMGSGAYEEVEKGISEVEITLTENTGSEKVYQTKTDANGDFLINDYIPGDYTLTYTWGDQTYTVQDYKGTIYDSTRNQEDKNWYKDQVDNRRSDAMDNYSQEQEAPKGSRLQIDEEIKNIKKGTTSAITRTKMDATTPTMGIGVEINDDGNIKYGQTSVETTVDGDRFVPEGFIIKNVDFGIVERAKQDLELTKRIKTLRATLANGHTLVDLEIDENGNITGEQKGITYMKPDSNMNPANGFIKLEMDNELIQGTRLEVGYEIKTTNMSELDYLSENFYQYGKEEGEVVTITPTALIDYLDNNWSFEESENPDYQWEVKSVDDIKDLVVEEVYNNNPNSTINNKIILYTQSLKNEKIKPGEARTIMLNASRRLSTTDEISFDNETEMVELDKTGGSIPESTPGNYIPGAGKTEADDSMAETTIVTPATGENHNYMLPIMIGAIALIGLGAGVVIIKKKVI